MNQIFRHSNPGDCTRLLTEIEMNYKEHYDKLINRGLNRKLIGYKENHHIIPKCMNGSDDRTNRVYLTAREHFVAHMLLVKIYPKINGLIYAASMMCVMSKNQDRSMNRMYDWLRRLYSDQVKNLRLAN